MVQEFELMTTNVDVVRFLDDGNTLALCVSARIGADVCTHN